MNIFLNKIRRCEVCKEYLPLGPRPVVQLSASSKIIIISQAPGRRVHETGENKPVVYGGSYSWIKKKNKVGSQCGKTTRVD